LGQGRRKEGQKKGGDALAKTKKAGGGGRIKRSPLKGQANGRKKEPPPKENRKKQNPHWWKQGDGGTRKRSQGKSRNDDTKGRKTDRGCD